MCYFRGLCRRRWHPARRRWRTAEGNSSTTSATRRQASSVVRGLATRRRTERYRQVNWPRCRTSGPSKPCRSNSVIAHAFLYRLSTGPSNCADVLNTAHRLLKTSWSCFGDFSWFICNLTIPIPFCWLGFVYRLRFCVPQHYPVCSA